MSKNNVKSIRMFFYLYYGYRITFVGLSMMGSVGYNWVSFFLHYRESFIDLHKDFLDRI